MVMYSMILLHVHVDASCNWLKSITETKVSVCVVVKPKGNFILSVFVRFYT